jgi:hypothetical protein
VPAVWLKCAGCGKKMTTYLNVLADVFGKYTKVLIRNGEAEGYELADTHTGTQPDYYCSQCWESTE